MRTQRMIPGRANMQDAAGTEQIRDSMKDHRGTLIVFETVQKDDSIYRTGGVCDELTTIGHPGLLRVTLCSGIGTGAAIRLRKLTCRFVMSEDFGIIRQLSSHSLTSVERTRQIFSVG